MNRQILISRNDYQVWYNMGVNLSKSRKYRQAITAFDKAIKIKPDYPEALNNRGNILKVLGRLNSALNNCNLEIGRAHV